MYTHIHKITNRFNIKSQVIKIHRFGEGFINDTYIVRTRGDDCDDYLLQRKNENVFSDIPGMMDNIHRVTTHLKQKIREVGGDPDREALTLIPAEDGKLYVVDENGDYWTLCIWIKDHVVYEKADTPELAEAGGRGIGKFQNMLSDFHEPLVDTLPGFHDIRFRFSQWDEAMEKDREGRINSVCNEIAWIDKRREEMLKFWKLVKTGEIPGRITHNDTKISNFLFNQKGEVLCVIDLDTVQNNIVLNDFGDAIRSYANRALEDEPDLDKVQLDLTMFRSYTRGYLSEAHHFLTGTEVEQLAFAPLLITFEQTLRFLMDHIDGDRYYRIKFPGHNLVRARSQHRLLQCMEQNYGLMQQIVEDEMDDLR